jgi:hypothetical protein
MGRLCLGSNGNGLGGVVVDFLWVMDWDLVLQAS